MTGGGGEAILRILSDGIKCGKGAFGGRSGVSEEGGGT